MDIYERRVIVGEDKKIRLEIVTDFAPGPVDVAVIMVPFPAEKAVKFQDYVGLGKEIWEGVDAQEYVNTLREGGDLDALFERARKAKTP